MRNSSQFLHSACRTLCLVGISFWVAMSPLADQTVNARDATPSTAEDASIRSDLSFDVVSIRPSAPNLREHMFGLLPRGGDEYRAIGIPLGTTLLVAYFPPAIGRRERVMNAPGWLWNDEYNFIGKVSDADLPEWLTQSQRGFTNLLNPMLQVMLQNAFKDRCKLALHRIPAFADGYSLVIASRGINRKNLTDSHPDDILPKMALKIALGGRMVPILSPEDPVLHFYGTSMAALAAEMSGLIGEPVEDRTNLAGKYNFSVTRIRTEGLPFYWNLAPLGLKLVPTKVPTENIVIDHIEKPSPN